MFLTSDSQCVSYKMNYLLAISCLLALTTSTKADGSWGGLTYAPGHASADYYAYPRYAFEYAVKDPHTGDNKAQWEKRDGDVVKGAYSLVEPDGSIRIVEYWADDKSGFNAVVKRIGPNLHPPTVRAMPIYKAPIPLLSSGAAIAPISVGPIAKYGGLAGAPLISGQYLGGAISSASLYKAPAIPVAPILSQPILAAPIIKQAPIYSAPYTAPLLPGPLIKSAPLLPSYASVPPPIYKTRPILTGLPSLSGFSGLSGPVYKDSLGWSGAGLGGGLIKGPLIGAAGLGDLGHGLLARSPYLGGGWNGNINYNLEYNYPHGLKH